MTQMLGNLAGWLGSPAGKGLGEVAGLGATGAGLVGNILADRQRAEAAAAAQRNMNLTPQQLAAQVASATQPLNRALVQAVTNTTNAGLAEQGLSQAPGLIATAESQALAPFEQANQQTAMNLVLQRLGLPAEFARTIPPNANLAPLIAMIMRGLPSNSPSGFPTTGPNLDQIGAQPTYGDTGPFDVGGFGGIVS